MRRIHTRFRHLGDESCEEEILHSSLTGCNHPVHVKMSHMFHRAQIECFEILVQQYWKTELEPIPLEARQPVPTIVKVALSWVIGEDKMSSPNSHVVDVLNGMMGKRVRSWKQSCLTGAPARPLPDMLRRFRFGTSSVRGSLHHARAGGSLRSSVDKKLDSTSRDVTSVSDSGIDQV